MPTQDMIFSAGKGAYRPLKFNRTSSTFTINNKVPRIITGIRVPINVPSKINKNIVQQAAYLAHRSASKLDIDINCVYNIGSGGYDLIDRCHNIYRLQVRTALKSVGMVYSRENDKKYFDNIRYFKFNSYDLKAPTGVQEMIKVLQGFYNNALFTLTYDPDIPSAEEKVFDVGDIVRHKNGCYNGEYIVCKKKTDSLDLYQVRFIRGIIQLKDEEAKKEKEIDIIDDNFDLSPEVRGLRVMIDSKAILENVAAHVLNKENPTLGRIVSQ